MTVRVLLFASYADALGSSVVSIDMPDGSRVRDVLARVKSMAGTKRLPDRPLVAINQMYATDEQPVTTHDEVAIIPPVSGG